MPEELLRECAMMLLCYDCLRHDGMLTLDRFNTGIQNQDCASSWYIQGPTIHDLTMHDLRIIQTCMFFIEIIFDIKGRKNIRVDMQRPALMAGITANYRIL